MDAMVQMFGAMMGKPHGHVKTLRYTKKALPQDHKASAPAAVTAGATASAAMGNDTLEVTYLTPNGEEQTWLANTGYNPENPTLMFLAAIGHRPSEFENQRLDVSDENITVPLQYDQSEGKYGIHADMLERGQKALIRAAWNPWTEDMVAIEIEDETAQDDSERPDDDPDSDDEHGDGIDVGVM
jgi:hypothetical protein